jgi:hypothetical protein
MIGARQRRLTWSRPVAVAIGVALVAIGLCAWQLTLPNVLEGVTEYDDGVYLGAAIRFVAGVLPYRNYVFVQPPGIIVLMSPLALLGRLIGSRDALIAVRVMTALVTGLNVGLAAWLVRRRGRFAMAIAGGALAVFPLAVNADHTLMLEPYLVLFILIGSVLAFDRDEPSIRRLVCAGLCFGIAGAVKLWAVFPFCALLVCFLPRWRARIMPLLGGCVLGFGLLCLPFVIGAPHAFIHEVLVDQLSRTSTAQNNWPIVWRLVAITGLDGIPSLSASAAPAFELLGALGLLVVVAYVLDRRMLRRIDTYILLAALASVIGILASPEFYRHYTYFSAPLLAALLAVAVSGTRTAIGRITAYYRITRPLEPLIRVLFLSCAVVALVLLVAEDTSYGRTVLPSGANGAIDPGAAIDTVIPKGSCVIFDEAILAIEANRFSSSSPSCPQIVDPYGMWLADTNGQAPPATPPFPTSFENAWKSYFEAAQYVVLWAPQSDYIPWDPALLTWFDRHYGLIQVGRGSYVYSRDATTASSHVPAP